MDDLTHRLAITVLGLMCLASVGGIVILEAAGRAAPTVLSNLATGCACAITALLTPRYHLPRPGDPRPGP